MIKVVIDRVTGFCRWLSQFAQDTWARISGEARQDPIHKFFHFWVLAGRTFVQNRCPSRATALAYTTLLALVPLLAVSLGVWTSLLKADEQQTAELIERLVEQVVPQIEQLPGTEEEKQQAQQQVIGRIQDFITNIHSGALGIGGTVALVFVAIGLLSTIESTFNDIWGVARGRGWMARIVHYWTAISLGPLIVILAMGLAVGPRFVQIEQLIQRMPFVGNLLFQTLPFVILCICFSLLYQVMPNTRVYWWAAAVGGVVTAILWTLNSRFSMVFASRVVSASKIYGPLGIIPVFLIGLYLSWLILLFGAQVAYAFQNRGAYLQEKLADRINQRGREWIAVKLMQRVALRFHRGDSPPAADDLSAELGVPSRLIRQLAQQLHENRLLAEDNSAGPGYVPGRPLNQISCRDILEVLRCAHGIVPEFSPQSQSEAVDRALDAITQAEGQAAQATNLQHLVDPGSRDPKPRADPDRAAPDPASSSG